MGWSSPTRGKSSKPAPPDSGRTRGNHTVWSRVGGRRTTAIPDGHMTLSPGVLSKINQKINEFCHPSDVIARGRLNRRT